MAERVDVIVVGAGPAGSTAAYRLAERGAKVVILDRQRFPRDKPCGGGVTLRGASVLPFAIDPVVERVVTRMDVRMGYGGPVCHVDGEGAMVYMTQRSRLDLFLAEQAVSAGADFRDGVRVRDIALRPDGVEVRTDTGVIAARAMVGADGCNGVSARALGVREHSYAVAMEGNLPRGAAGYDDSAWRDAALLEFDVVPGGYGWIFPKGDHVNVGVGGYLEEGPRMRDHLRRICEVHGITIGDLEHVRGHRLPIRRSGTPVATHRMVLAGDAAGLVDPFSGDGMYEAFTSSRIAARTIGEVLDGTAADCSAYPARLAGALGPHVASAWAAKYVIEKAPWLMFGLLRTPRVRRIVGRRLRAEPREHTSERGLRISAAITRASRRGLGPSAA
ncbi:MAG: NAD(P)/FAD-dependent oxidoreductase [Thermoleophilia bacterium]|nr:NAD(P)/FAD-dependent oxidoreductase [Thermoleophilia bacterium]